MKAWSAVGRELVGLFIDDGSLALALIAWVAVVALAAHLVAGGRWGGGLLLAGCIAVLAENIVRSARRAARADIRGSGEEQDRAVRLTSGHG